MTNNRLDDAELEVLLSGDQRKVDRYLITGIRELGEGLGEVKAEVKEMREVCEARSLLGMSGCIADPPVPVPPVLVPIQGDRRVWVMWGVGIFAAIAAANALIVWGVERLFH